MVALLFSSLCVCVCVCVYVRLCLLCVLMQRRPRAWDE